MATNDSFNGTNVTNNGPSLEQQSWALMNAQFKPAILVCVLSLIAFVTNTLLMVTIAKTKELHNKSQFVIFSHSLIEALHGFFTSVISGRKIISPLLGTPDVVSRVNCMAFILMTLVSNKATLYAILMLGIDRLMAVGLPIPYSRFKTLNYLLCLNIVCWGVAVIRVPFAFICMDSTLIPCSHIGAPTVAYRYYETTESQVLAVVTVMVYGMAIGIVSGRYWGTKWSSPSDRSAWSKKIQMGAFKMMMAVGFIYLLCWGTSQGIVSMLSWTGSAASAFYGPYVASLQVLNTASHLFVYYGISNSFRKAFKKVIFKQEGTPITSIAQQKSR